MPDAQRVLLVDDTDLASLQVLIPGDALEVAGTATSGEDAVRLASEQQFDVAVVDYMMPGMDGVQTAEKLKEIQPAIKVVILTSYDVRDVVTASPHVDHFHEKIAIESLADAIRAMTGAGDQPKKGRRGRRR